MRRWLVIVSVLACLAVGERPARARSWGARLARLTGRALTAAELSFASRVFGRVAWLKDVRIVRSSLVTALAPQHAVTLFSTIHASWELDLETLVHELTHVWQSRRLGPRYLADALAAQVGDGYAYGGARELRRRRRAGGTIDSFNLEQQGDILADYVARLATGRDVSAWKPYVEDVQRAAAVVAVIGR